MKKHLLQAAERGDAEAQFNLGIMYENGLEDSRYAVDGRKRPEAVRWLLAVAEQGLPRAQIKLAEMYAGEPEIPGNSVAAVVARDNARTAALGGQALRAKSWIRVLGMLQRQQAAKASPVRAAGDPSLIGG